MSIFDGNMSIEAVCASGIEAVLKREISALGYSVGGANYGRIRFEGDFLDVVRANVFLRTASRIRIVVCEFDALTFDELYD
ncbi:MAG: THUMP domain-containing protein, partial [Clostridia bacterium]